MKRKLIYWTDEFVQSTDNLESPTLFRRWVGIAILASVLEQKVWLTTTSPIFPNVYAFLVGHPGTGKTRAIRAAKGYLQEIPDFHFAPTSMTAAALVDALTRAKRTLIRLPDPPIEYNSMTITAEELTAFMHKYDDEMIGVLSHFYDPDPYVHERRGGELKIKIKSPQLNIITGTTPSNLLKFLPEFAWDQGFTSRAMLIFSDERFVGDDFDRSRDRPKVHSNLLYDLRIINSLTGPFKVTEAYRQAIFNWRKLGEPLMPTHPKLLHYVTRRKVHLYKLSMIASIDRGSDLILTVEDFNRAMSWLLEAEEMMPEIFQAGAVGGDAKAMDEIYHYIKVADIRGKGISEHKVINFARERVPAHSVLRVIEVMEKSGLIKATAYDKRSGLRLFKAVSKGQDELDDLSMS